MLRLVTTNNAAMFRHLQSDVFKRVDVEHVAAASYFEALSTVARAKPQVAIVDAELAGGSGYELCRTLKDDVDLRNTFVIIALSSAITALDYEKLAECGCDDVICLPLPSDELYHHIAELTGLPMRREQRVDTSLEVMLPGRNKPVMGTVVNASTRGAGVQVSSELHPGMHVRLRFIFNEQTYPAAGANVIWAQPTSVPGETYAGLEFDNNIPTETKTLLGRLALFDVSSAHPDSPMAGGVHVALQGEFNELTSFEELALRLETESLIDFDAAAIRYISSAGVHSWCHLLNKLEGKRYVFRRCSVAFALQAATVPMVVGSGQILSLEAPYVCEACNREELRLLTPQVLLRADDKILPPRLACHTCNGALEFDDMPNRYFAFL